jgi:hypothetical protein
MRHRDDPQRRPALGAALVVTPHLVTASTPRVTGDV